jgi:hypothetical protein
MWWMKMIYASALIDAQQIRRPLACLTTKLKGLNQEKRIKFKIEPDKDGYFLADYKLIFVRVLISR